MQFLVYEQDPLVRDDILETLKEAFSGVIHLIEDLRDFGCCNEQQNTPSVVILSVSGQDVLKERCDTFSLPSRAGVVIICDDLPAETETCVPAQFVPRPFNSRTLISAIRTALSSQLRDPS